MDLLELFVTYSVKIYIKGMESSWNMEDGTWKTEHGRRNMEDGTWKTEDENRNPTSTEKLDIWL